jgi:hypothetical protein
MPVITLRVDDATRDEVDRVARARGVTVSELLRQAIEEVVGHKETHREAVGEMFGEELDVRRTDIPRTLSPVERQTLAMLHEVLAHLDPDDDDDDELAGHRRHAEALRRGFAGEYNDEFAGIEPEISLAECELLWDVLDMFRVLKASVTRLSPDQTTTLSEASGLGDTALRALTFRGLDTQDARESRLLGYARHLIKTGRWEDLAEHFDRTHDRGNSHSRTLPSYLRMLDAYQPIWKAKISGRGLGPDGLLLSVDELAAVARAWPHPSAASS